ncbi:MAG: ABC transporter ATP-binding protein [Chthoniobacteraceae bacterium]
MAPALRVEELSKQYHLGLINRGLLYQELQSRWARWRGRADPHARIVEHTKRNEDGSFWALRNVSFDVEQGDVVGIIGRNGAGKSTLLKVLSQITSPTEGRVLIKGRIASLLEVGTGFHPELTGRENVFLNGAILGMSHREIAAKFDEIAAFAGVEEFLDTPVKRYSSGMTVRLAFAVAAHLEPEILVVDEVLAVGDETFQQKCLGKMDEVTQREGRTLLFVSHNMAAVNNLCRRTIVMDEGRVAFDGPTAEAVSHYLQHIARHSDDPDANPARYAEDAGKPFQLREVALRDAAGAPCLKFDFEDEATIEIQLQVHTRDPDYFTVITVTDSVGNWVYFSSDDDLSDPPVGKVGPGLYRYRLRLPARLLKPGGYWLDVVAARRNHGKIDRRDGALQFQIVDTQSRRAVKQLYRKPAIVAPEIAWTFEG